MYVVEVVWQNISTEVLVIERSLSLSNVACTVTETVLQDKARLLTAIAYRAQRATAGYYAGYMSKRQPVGEFEIAKAVANLKFLQEKLKLKSPVHQVHTVVNRMFGDLEFRGSVRPITEEFNLAGNHDKRDVLNAEFYRTSQFAQFSGGNILRLLRNRKRKASHEDDTMVVVPKPVGFPTKKGNFDAAPEQKYGHRGNHAAFLYLSPWEFCQWWCVERLKPPRDDVPHRDDRTTWTEAGLQYREENRGNKQAEAPKAGEHYVVVDCADFHLYCLPQGAS